MKKPSAEAILKEVVQEYIDHISWKPDAPTVDALISPDMQALVRVAMEKYARHYIIFRLSEKQQ